MATPADWSDPRLMALLDQLQESARVGRRMQARADVEDVRAMVLERLTRHGPLLGAPPLPVWESYLRQTFASVVVDLHRLHSAEMRDYSREMNEAALADGHSADSAPQLAGVLPAPDTSPSQRAAKNEDLSRLDAAIERLSEDQRRVIRLHLAGHGPSAIAAQIGRSPDSVSSLIRRAMLQLKDDLL